MTMPNLSPYIVYLPLTPKARCITFLGSTRLDGTALYGPRPSPYLRSRLMRTPRPPASRLSPSVIHAPGHGMKRVGYKYPQVYSTPGIFPWRAVSSANPRRPLDLKAASASETRAGNARDCSQYRASYRLHSSVTKSGIRC